MIKVELMVGEVTQSGSGLEVNFIQMSKNGKTAANRDDDQVLVNCRKRRGYVESFSVCMADSTLVSKFKPGQKFYLDFTEAAE